MITEAQLNQYEALRLATLDAVRSVGFKGDALVQIEIEYMQLALELVARANQPVMPTPPPPLTEPPINNGNYPPA
jgi:hypothetical protein